MPSMITTVRCPDCDAELALTTSLEQEAKCPRCARIFTPGQASTNITATQPRLAGSRDSSDVDEPIEPRGKTVVIPPPAGEWLALGGGLSDFSVSFLGARSAPGATATPARPSAAFRVTSPLAVAVNRPGNAAGTF